MAGNFLFKEESLQKEISVLSGGEKARLCLANILLQKSHVLLLDEPTNHLDFETVEALAMALRESNSTIFFVSHNRAFVETLANGIIEVKDGRAARYHHNYEDYVYHMQRAMENDLGQGGIEKKSEESNSDLTVSKIDNREELRAMMKKANNEIRKIEAKMKSLEEERQILLAWFEANSGQYSEEKSLRVGEIIKMLELVENEWMAVQLRIEDLKKS